MSEFRTIGLMGRVGNPEVLETLLQLRDLLLSRGCAVLVEAEAAEYLSPSRGAVCERERIGLESDLVIVVGGDGSLLGAARSLAAQRAPVLGVNRGRLGFLTDISPQQLESQIDAVLGGEYELESRFLLDIALHRGDAVLARGDALNDVVLNSGISARMIEFELYIENQFVYTQRSDGLIISTPTGSTAYSLSGGGPIMHPKLDAIVLVPMFPHTLGSRPLVVDGNSEVKIVINAYNELQPSISCDGQVNMSASPGDIVQIRKKPTPLRLLHPRDHNFYAICRAKLGWGTRPGE